VTEAKPQHEVRHPSELHVFHKNPRVGNVDAIAASLRANSQYRPIVVNRGTHTGRPLEVLAGNHTLMAFRDLAEKHPEDERWQSIDCWMIDVDDDRAARIVAADNRTAELGGFDDRLLLELLQDLPDLNGTGYDANDLMALADIVGGAPTLEELEKEIGEPQPGDDYTMIRLAVTPDVGKEWERWREQHGSDTQALGLLLESVSSDILSS